MTFDPFRRLRLRAHTVPSPPSSEEDSDRSSPECGRTHVIHVPVPSKNGRRGDRILAVSNSEKKMPCGPSEKPIEGTHIALPLVDAPHHLPLRSPKNFLGAATSDAVDAPAAKPSLLRRVTSKLVISIPSKSNPALRSRPSMRILPANMPPSPQQARATIAVAPTLPNSFVSKQHREAALRERGLLPPRKDLSEQEREADERLARVPPPANVTLEGISEAEQFKSNWLAMKQSLESSDLDGGRAPPCQQETKPRPRSTIVSPSLDPEFSPRSGEAKADVSPLCRPSICISPTSVPPLLTSSHLEVLHEEPSEQGPITPLPPLSPVNVPIVVSSPLESATSQTIVESPTSYTFSSRCAGSTLESQSQSDHLSVPEKENIRLSARRRRTVDSTNQGRKVGSTLSSFGTRSLSNLRRSVAGSLRVPSSTTLSSTADLHLPQVPRTAISPTIHSIGSIVRETRHIADVESRRLSELAFLD